MWDPETLNKLNDLWERKFQEGGKLRRKPGKRATGGKSRSGRSRTRTLWDSLRSQRAGHG